MPQYKYTFHISKYEGNLCNSLDNSHLYRTEEMTSGLSELWNMLNMQLKECGASRPLRQVERAAMLFWTLSKSGAKKARKRGKLCSMSA
jgi:hypothetical protein